VQAKRDTESSIFSKFWIPASAGMTSLIMISNIAVQFAASGGERENDAGRPPSNARRRERKLNDDQMSNTVKD
jgi:hypothetical protein